MIIDARYEGPPYMNGALGPFPSKPMAGCSSCVRGPNLSGSSLAGPLSTNTTMLVLFAIGAIGLTLYSFNGKSKKSLSGRKGRR